MSQDGNVWCPHVTVATVVPDADGRFLVVEEDIHGELQYNQPAGHLEPDEALADAAVRETLEETSRDIALEHFVGVHQWWSPVHGDHIVRFSFAGRVVHHHPERALDAGVQRALWLSRDAIADTGRTLRSPLVLASIDDWLGGQRLPLSTLKCHPAPTPSTP